MTIQIQWLVLVLPAVALLGLSGAGRKNTTHGVGKDLDNAGEKIQEKNKINPWPVPLSCRRERRAVRVGVRGEAVEQLVDRNLKTDRRTVVPLFPPPTRPPEKVLSVLSHWGGPG